MYMQLQHHCKAVQPSLSMLLSHQSRETTALCFVAGQLFASIVGQALQGLQQLSDFARQPDMADDTFLLISRAVRYSRGVVLNAHMLPLILQASMAGVLVQHRWALAP